MNRIGLWLGFISGLLLIPEVVNMIPSERFENAIRDILSSFERFSNLPQQFHPLLWQILYTEEARKKYIEPVTAVLGLLASTTWTSTVIVGLITSSRFFLALGLLLPIYIAIERIIQKHGFSLPIYRFLILFFTSILFSLALAPLTSFARVLLLLLRTIVIGFQRIFSRHAVIRSLVTLIAILLFVASNIFQLLAAY